MAAIVKLGTASNTGGPLRLPIEARTGAVTTQDYMGVRISSIKIERVGGKEDSIISSDGIAHPRQTVLITPGFEMHPVKYQILVGYNPELLRYGTVSCPSIISYQMINKLALQFSAFKKVNLLDLDYIFELYMID